MEIRKQNNEVAYAYAGNNTMATVISNRSGTFHGTLTAITTGSTFQNLDEAVLKVTVMDHGISASIARSNPLEVWADYLAGDNYDLRGQSEEPGGEYTGDKGDDLRRGDEELNLINWILVNRVSRIESKLGRCNMICMNIYGTIHCFGLLLSNI